MDKRLIVTASALVFAGSVFADTGKMHGEEGKSAAGGAMQQQAAENRQVRLELEFSQLDQDNDGTINREEYEQAVQEQWKKVDADSDGSVSEAEFAAFVFDVQGREPTGSDTMMGEGDAVPPR